MAVRRYSLGLLQSEMEARVEQTGFHPRFAPALQLVDRFGEIVNLYRYSVGLPASRCVEALGRSASASNKLYLDCCFLTQKFEESGEKGEDLSLCSPAGASLTTLVCAHGA